MNSSKDTRCADVRKMIEKNKVVSYNINFSYYV